MLYRVPFVKTSGVKTAYLVYMKIHFTVNRCPYYKVGAIAVLNNGTPHI